MKDETRKPRKKDLLMKTAAQQHVFFLFVSLTMGVCNLNEKHLLKRQILERTKLVTFVLCAMSIIYHHTTARWQYTCPTLKNQWAKYLEVASYILLSLYCYSFSH